MSTELLTPAELADLLKVAPRTVRDWYHAGMIPARVAIGKTYRFALADVEQALADAARKKAKQSSTRRTVPAGMVPVF